MRLFLLCLSACLSVAVVAQPVSPEEGRTHSHPLNQWAEGGLNAEIYYTADLLTNTSGGADTGTRYLQNLDLIAELDTAAFGKPFGQFFVYALYNDSTTFSDVVGDLQVLSNIEANHRWRLYELWWNFQPSDQLDILAGLYDLNSEFDAIDTAGLFLNSSHGIGPDYSQSGLNGPSIFPSTSATLRVEFAVNEATTLRYAILDAVPGDLNNPDEFASFDIDASAEGFLHAMEFDRTWSGGVRTVLGAWRYTEEFEKINETDGFGQPISDTGNQGLYGFVDAPIYQDENGGVFNAFLRYGVANEEFNQLSSYIGFGGVYSGLISGRPEDKLGLAFAVANNGDDFKTSQLTPVDDRETSVELTYSAQLTDKLRIQPNIQYIMNPGADPSLDNALVAGVRIELGASFGH